MTESTNATNGLPLFQLGKIVATPGALDALDQTATNASVLLLRHQHGDWGGVSPDDAEQNDLALQDDSRLMSSYQLSEKVVVWVITESDRSVTTLLLPEEY